MLFDVEDLKRKDVIELKSSVEQDEITDRISTAFDIVFDGSANVSIKVPKFPKDFGIGLIVGSSGSGKSTLLKILCGMEHPTDGTVSVASDTTIGYLPQVMKLADTRTVRQEAETAFEDIHKLKAEVERLNNQMVERTDYESEDYHALIDRFFRPFKQQPEYITELLLVCKS